MSSQHDISITDIDRALEALPGTFTVGDLQKRLGNQSDGLARRLERLLDGDDRFFNIPGGAFQRREDFFKGFKFAVTFDRWEISQGFLIPGHRFSPFLHPEVFPSETTERRPSGEVKDALFSAYMPRVKQQRRNDKRDFFIRGCFFRYIDISKSRYIDVI